MADLVQKVVDLDRLNDVIVVNGWGLLVIVTFVRVSGYHDNGPLVLPVAKYFRGCPAVYIRHGNIHHHHIRSDSLRHRDTLFRGTRLSNDFQTGLRLQQRRPDPERGELYVVAKNMPTLLRITLEDAPRAPVGTMVGPLTPIGYPIRTGVSIIFSASSGFRDPSTRWIR